MGIYQLPSKVPFLYQFHTKYLEQNVSCITYSKGINSVQFFINEKKIKILNIF